MIFENTRRSDNQFLQSTSTPVPVNVSASDLNSIGVDQFLQSEIPTVGTDHQMIHEVIHAPPLQDMGSRSIVGTDPDFATSEKSPTDENVKIENENVTDCVKFIRAAILENDPQSDRPPFQKI